MTVTQAELASWVGAASTSLATIVALGLAVWEIRRSAKERRDREVAQARLVAVTVPIDADFYIVAITNFSESPVHRPLVESMGDSRPPARLEPPERPMITSRLGSNDHAVVLPPGETYRARFDYYITDGIRLQDKPKKPVKAEEVTITFTDTSGLRWRRTGSGEPIRDLQQARRTIRRRAAPPAGG